MKKIFILDDNAATLSSIIITLQKDYEVTCCRDILSAKRRLKIFTYDLIVLDLMLPTRGLEVKDEFKAGYNFYLEVVKELQNGVPVIFWSNLTEASFTQFTIEHPDEINVSYLQKDDNGQNLIEKVNKELKS